MYVYVCTIPFTAHCGSSNKGHYSTFVSPLINNKSWYKLDDNLPIEIFKFNEMTIKLSEGVNKRIEKTNAFILAYVRKTAANIDIVQTPITNEHIKWLVDNHSADSDVSDGQTVDDSNNEEPHNSNEIDENAQSQLANENG